MKPTPGEIWPLDRVGVGTGLPLEGVRILATAPSSLWVDRLTADGVACAPIYDVAGALEQPQVAGGDLIADVELATGRVVKMVASPITIDGVRPPIRRRPPTMGEHADDLAAPRRGG